VCDSKRAGVEALLPRVRKMVGLFENPEQRAAIREEFDRQTKGQTYQGYIPDGPPPVPKD